MSFPAGLEARGIVESKSVVVVVAEGVSWNAETGNRGRLPKRRCANSNRRHGAPLLAPPLDADGEGNEVSRRYNFRSSMGSGRCVVESSGVMAALEASKSRQCFSGDCSSRRGIHVMLPHPRVMLPQPRVMLDTGQATILPPKYPKSLKMSSASVLLCGRANAPRSRAGLVAVEEAAMTLTCWRCRWAGRSSSRLVLRLGARIRESGRVYVAKRGIDDVELWRVGMCRGCDGSRLEKGLCGGGSW